MESNKTGMFPSANYKHPQKLIREHGYYFSLFNASEMQRIYDESNKWGHGHSLFISGSSYAAIQTFGLIQKRAKLEMNIDDITCWMCSASLFDCTALNYESAAYLTRITIPNFMARKIMWRDMMDDYQNPWVMMFSAASEDGGTRHIRVIRTFLLSDAPAPIRLNPNAPIRLNSNLPSS